MRTDGEDPLVKVIEGTKINVFIRLYIHTLIVQKRVKGKKECTLHYIMYVRRRRTKKIIKKLETQTVDTVSLL